MDDLSFPPEEPMSTLELAQDPSLYMLSAATVTSTEHPRTLQFIGAFQGHAITILVDFGSTHSFLSSIVASKLEGVQTLPVPVAVKIADGGSLICAAELLAVEWSVQGYCFHSNLKILQLGIYDLILGMDWLQAFWLMKINW